MSTKTRPERKKFGNKERYTYSKIEEVLEIPNLIEVQKTSYENFLKTGIGEVFADFSPFRDLTGKIELHIMDYSIDGEPKYSEKECKERDTTYAVPLKVKVRLVNMEKNGEMIDQEIFMGDMPKMTPNGSFIINGAERVVVSQLVRSPGIYCESEKDKNGIDRYKTTIIPSRGAWLEFEEDAAGSLSVHVDRTRKISATTLLRCLGFGTDISLDNLFHGEEMIKLSIGKDFAHTEEDALYELNKRLRPGEIPNAENIKTNISNMFFDAKRYDLSRVGRYKFNKKLDLTRRAVGQVLADNIIDENGVLVAQKGITLTKEIIQQIVVAGINEIPVSVNEQVHYIIGNNMVPLDAVVECNPKELGILEHIHYPTLREIMQECTNKEELLDKIFENAVRLVPKHIMVDDIVGAVNYTIGLKYGIGNVDNIDHLGNRRVRSVGELLQNQFRLGISRLERVIRERMQIQDTSDVTPQALINIRPVTSAIKEFFGSSQLSQFMDQSNPIAELTHKRKLSALGPGGLNRDRASFEVRDVHYSHYGRMCPIETPEGQNVGLISSLSTYAKINEYGFIESPYRRVDKQTKTVTKEVYYLPADEEDNYVIAQANSDLDENNWFTKQLVQARYREEIVEIDREEIDFMDVSPKQLVSIATALIPFLENDDTTRALMGSNMQRQAVPLLRPEAPIIGTGMEHKVARDSGVMVLSKVEGTVDYVSADYILVKDTKGEIVWHELQKFQRSNQGTCVNHRPLVKKGDKVVEGSVLADGPSTDNGDLALGKNILIGFMSWEGYNYEDAILISEKLVKEDVFTSIHIEEHEIEARDTKLGPEEITREIPNTSEENLKDLDENGIIRVGAEVRSTDILVGKVTPKGEAELTPEERLLRAIFGEKVREVRDTSLRVPHGEGGIVVDVKIFTRENKDELSPGVNKLVRVYIAQKRKISVGDKMAGRHGNKGVISRILPEADMPFMADGTPLQIVLNPLGVPSRMNIGQVLEVHLGLVAKALGWYIATPVFDGVPEKEIAELLRANGYENDGVVDGKIELFDGRTGEPFKNRVTVGYMYMLKLVHLVDDKIHARSVGPYSLVTQQPLGGKAQFGGQRFGEMEVWALYAYGAANILQEIMTVKSDDIVGRVKTYESIVKGLNVSEPNVPESFKVLIKELQSLALDMKVLTEDGLEINICDLIEDEREQYDSDKRKSPVFDYGDDIDIADGDAPSFDTEFGAFDDEEEDFGDEDILGDNKDAFDFADEIDANFDDFGFDDEDEVSKKPKKEK